MKAHLEESNLFTPKHTKALNFDVMFGFTVLNEHSSVIQHFTLVQLSISLGICVEKREDVRIKKEKK